MPCFRPMEGFYGAGRTVNGKRRLVFPRSEHEKRAAAIAAGGEVFDIPCGKCEGCLLARAQEWASRCEQEASLWRENSFVTLTYRPETLPVVGGFPTLRMRDFQLFMKRLRKVRPGVRFVVAGEYGAGGRPHYHALLFNCGFPDKQVLLSGDRRRPGAHTLYRSELLETLWTLGFSSIGEVTFESAAYVARYTLKKHGALAASLSEVAAASPVEGEFLRMSLKPGIGAGWFKRFRGDVFPSDEVVGRGGRKLRPPRYYGVLFEREDPEGFAVVKAKRKSLPDPDNYLVVVGGQAHDRLGARRELARRRLSDKLKREL